MKNQKHICINRIEFPYLFFLVSIIPEICVLLIEGVNPWKGEKEENCISLNQSYPQIIKTCLQDGF